MTSQFPFSRAKRPLSSASQCRLPTILLLCVVFFVCSMQPAFSRVSGQNSSHEPQLAIGVGQFLFLDGDGAVRAWGNGASGQLGVGVAIYDHNYDGYDPDVPAVVKNLKPIAVAAGNDFSLALLPDGSVFSWGSNSDGRLGLGPIPGVKPEARLPQASSIPVRVPGISGATAISAGNGVGAALLRDGRVLQWGRIRVESYYGKFPHALLEASPVPVSGVRNATAISAGNEHTLALLRDGTVVAWGRNRWGQLGHGAKGEDSFEAVPVSGLAHVVAVAAGDQFSMALRDDGTVWTWGYNMKGQLGNGEHGDLKINGTPTCCKFSEVPVKVIGISGATAIAAGVAHGLALLKDGTVRGWGYNAFGNLGIGGFADDVPTVQAVKGLTNVASIAAGGNLSGAVKKDGGVFAWGAIYYGSGKKNNPHGTARVPAEIIKPR